jgi:hypothetical protein
MLETNWWLIGGAVYLLVCGIAGWSVAQEKNRGDVENWIFGFLFGPLGVLIKVCLPTLPPKTEPTE